MKLYIVRHAESTGNRDRICQGWKDYDLSEEGIIQSKSIALKLKDAKIDTVFCSDLKRAKDTAKEILKYHKCKINIDKRLRGRGKGACEGKPKPDKKRTNYPEGETFTQVYNRVTDFFKDMEGNNVLIVTHGSIVSILLHLVNNGSFKDYKKTVFIKNTSLTVVDNKKVLLFNSTEL